MQERIRLGAERTAAYLPILKNKKVGIVANQTSMVGSTHLVDTLKSLGIDIKMVFSLEHGFRGDADAGEQVENSVDQKTGIPVSSLYGKNKKPSAGLMDSLDVLIFDIQDVGARFYTYISSMHYIMEACAESGKVFLVLDRPNPNGDYVDGPVLEKGFESFVGIHPGVPVVHGMTVGEYARMVNGEGWLENKIHCDLNVISMQNYTHDSLFALTVKPSPNLPNMNAIYLYPSLCLFEGTVVSEGRGTYQPFEQIGHPDLKGMYSYHFTPQSIQGMSKEPKYMGKVCYGIDLSKEKQSREFSLKWLIQMYKDLKREDFFNPFFDKLAGTDKLRQQILDGRTEDEIRKSWEQSLLEFKTIRSNYLLYPDFIRK